MLYSAKVMDHFMNPRNVGAMEDADGVGQVGSARCGDSMKIYLKIEDGIITKATFETFGCGSAIASSSMATVLITGKPLSQALALTTRRCRGAGWSAGEKAALLRAGRAGSPGSCSGLLLTETTSHTTRRNCRCTKRIKGQHRTKPV